ncbi:hypothetical protein MASR2M78_25370 [Treponema sp.]
MRRVPLLPDRTRPLFFAHRGCSSLAPENTLASFRLARQLGSPGLELDIHRCASGELVVAHDDDFRRCAGSPLIIEEAEWKDIRGLDVGSHKGDEFSGERVPLIQDVLDEFSGTIYIDIELKSRKSSGDELPALLARILHSRSDAKRLASSILVSSFNPLALAAFKAQAPEFATRHNLARRWRIALVPASRPGALDFPLRLP